MKLVSSLMDSVSVLISSVVSKFGVSGGFRSALGSSDALTPGPHVSMLVATNSCLKSGWAMPDQSVI